jgi:HD domain-containing protein
MPLAEMPATAAAAAAREVAAAYWSPAMFNHSVRAYLFGMEYARVRGIQVDDELLFVSAMFHDIGLVDAFDSHRVDFEHAGGHVAWVFCAGAGWPVQRRQRVADVIIAHMVEVPAEEEPEGHVLGESTGIDISGRAVHLVADIQDEVLAAYPRLDLAAEFTACFVDQAARKPESKAAAFVRSGIADRIAANPLER